MSMNSGCLLLEKWCYNAAPCLQGLITYGPFSKDIHLLNSLSFTQKGGAGGVFLFGRMFDNSFLACTFFLSFLGSGD